MPQAIVLFLTFFVMIIGLIFTVIPPIPGTVIIWAAAIGYGWLLGWDKLGWATFIIMTLLMVAGVVADFLGGQFGAKLGGASCLAIAVGTLCGLVLGLVTSLVGTPLLGLVGGLGGTLGGILLVERLRYGDWSSAMTATKGFLAGNIIGIMAKVTAGVLMFATFLARVYIWG
ncbi:MAG TPA: DUF456 domain-containing protein [Anaerolineae bacterium]|nr:DUF456 domain-containing protein [Anaerolineae bacterium]